MYDNDELYDEHPLLLRILFSILGRRILGKMSNRPPIMPLIGTFFLSYFMSYKIAVPISKWSIEIFDKPSIESIIIISTVSVVSFLVCHAYFHMSISREWINNNLLADFVYINSPNFDPIKATVVALWASSGTLISGLIISTAIMLSI